MRHHEAIYVPTDTVVEVGGYSLFRNPANDATDYVSELEEDCDVIVLTIEEAHDLFIAGMRRQRWVKGVLAGETVDEHPDFKTYIQSKGISI
ncbi:MAG TPA: hypothetical protein VMR70_04030 [Flavisolibacter sp.]|nr:hypothetical protein [Flavisolibacter sp.]